MKKILIIFFLLVSCSSNQSQNKTNTSNFTFSENMSFEQFKIKLEEYAKNNPYPNINN